MYPEAWTAHGGGSATTQRTNSPHEDDERVPAPDECESCRRRCRLWNYRLGKVVWTGCGKLAGFTANASMFLINMPRHSTAVLTKIRSRKPEREKS